MLLLGIGLCFLLSFVTNFHKIGQLQPASLPLQQPLTGTWQFLPASFAPNNQDIANLDDSKWQQIEVPSNWFLQGKELSGKVWYRHKFKADTSVKDKFVNLVFEGVDYTADIWLNGHYLGFHEGYFQPFSFVVSNLLNFAEDNVLLVRVDSPYEEPGQVWSLHKHLIKGVFNHHDTRPGGAWSMRGQDKNTGGIWASVYLRVSQQLAIDQVKVLPRIEAFSQERESKEAGKQEKTAQPATFNLSTSQKQDATAEVSLTTTYAGTVPKKFQFRLQLKPDNFSGAPDRPIVESRTLQPGVNQLTFQLPSQNTRFWWTWEHGQPNLYQVAIAILDDNQLLDQTETVFGFRTIDFDSNSGVWRLNGKRLFLRGTNYISTQWLSEMTRDKYVRDIKMMKQANINVIRVHAHVEAPEFYQMCDAAGILVWQDFPLQWGYTDAPAFITEATRQAKDMVALLYNHPSIIAWSLHNEPPWNATWMKDKYPDYDPNQNRVLDNTLFTSLTDADPTRYLHKYSSVEEHPWLGWYSGSWQDYRQPTKQPLITEFGAQALPDLPSLRKIFTSSELWPDTDAEWEKWHYHNFQQRETFEIAKVDRGNNIDEFIANTQQYQAQLIQFATESYRRQRFQPVGSIFQFMFVESWPSVNWGIVDYWRNLKPGYEALKVAYQPVLPSIACQKQVWRQGEPVMVELWIINDLWQRFPGAQLSYILQNHDISVESKSVTLDVEPDSGKKVLNFQKSQLQPDKYQLLVKIVNKDGQLIAKNKFDFQVVENEKK